MRWPIRYQLLVPLLTLLLGVVGVSTWTALASVDFARRQIETQVRHVAHTLSESRHVPLTSKTVLEQMKGLSGADYLLIAGDGSRSTTLPTDNPDLLPVEAVAEDWETLRLGPRVTVAGHAYLCSGVRLLPRADIPEGGTLYILYPEELWRSALWEAVRPSLFLGVFAGLASLVLAVAVAEHFGRRVREMERRTRLIAAGDFSPMRLPGRNDELRDLGRSINEMAEQLARLQEAVQRNERLRLLGQVGGGLAHQLRNGLTGARLALQLHARECGNGGDGEALAVALRQLTLLEAYLKRFLDLGRSGPSRREPVALRSLVGETVALLGPRCKHSRIDLRWQPPTAEATVLGDAGQIGQLLLNVIGNAIEAAGPGGWVEVLLRREPAPASVVVIEVSDSGPGPPADVAAKLFEPFVTGKPEGVGLGLAVARQVAEAHGGHITWRRDGAVTRFRIELPALPLAA
ncbi:MAG TPA: HAMP domain-containing sensor histidine kinase [Gemmataceae bacterium]|nr:HAMP domain-containing sensor histidine kinase [Gemmataceae bacterium]